MVQLSARAIGELARRDFLTRSFYPKGETTKRALSRIEHNSQVRAYALDAIAGHRRNSSTRRRRQTLGHGSRTRTTSPVSVSVTTM